MKTGREIAEKLGLEIQGELLSTWSYIADDVHKILEKAFVSHGVSAIRQANGKFSIITQPDNGILIINIQPIKPKKVEFETTVLCDSSFFNEEIGSLFGKRVKVTVEELK